ncbi:hypothetical protein, partial [Streptomyces ardesiacus]
QPLTALVRHHGWEIIEIGSGTQCIRQPATPGDPDIAADIADVVRGLGEQGQKPILPVVGKRLRSRWGVETYKKITSKQPLTALVRHHGWEIIEIGSGTQCIRQPATPGDQDGSHAGGNAR